MADPLIGRDEELSAVRAFLSTSRDGPALVLLDGEAGIGKTSVWEAAIAAEASGRGDVFVEPAAVAGLEGVHGVTWTVRIAGGAAAYQTSCTAVTLD